MEIKIQARNMEITDRAESYIQKKFDRLERHLSQISDAKIEVYRSSARSQAKSVIAQMTLSTGKYTLRGQDSGVNLFAAVDAVTDVVDRQISRLKGKVYRSGQSGRPPGHPASRRYRRWMRSTRSEKRRRRRWASWSGPNASR